MQPRYFTTNLGIVCKTEQLYRLKTTYSPKDLTEAEFAAQEPQEIDKKTYLEQLNLFFAKTPHKWEWQGATYKRLQNFQLQGTKITNYNKSDMKWHTINNRKCWCLIYHDRLVYAYFISPTKICLLHQKTHNFLSYTHPKNLAPVLNLKTKKII